MARNDSRWGRPSSAAFSIVDCHGVPLSTIVHIFSEEAVSVFPFRNQCRTLADDLAEALALALQVAPTRMHDVAAQVQQYEIHRALLEGVRQ